MSGFGWISIELQMKVQIVGTMEREKKRFNHLVQLAWESSAFPSKVNHYFYWKLNLFLFSSWTYFDWFKVQNWINGLIVQTWLMLTCTIWIVPRWRRKNFRPKKLLNFLLVTSTIIILLLDSLSVSGYNVTLDERMYFIEKKVFFSFSHFPTKSSPE